MPNWVGTLLCFKGPQEDLEKLYETLTQNGAPSIEPIIPVPEDLNTISIDYDTEAAVYVWDIDHPLAEDYPEHMTKQLGMYQTWEHVLKRAKKYHQELKTLAEQQKFVEMGRKVLLNIKKYGFASALKWCAKNWGTEWDLTDVDLELPFRDTMNMSFQTAWSCPLPFLQTVAKQYPSISFEGRFADSDISLGNQGVFSAENGAFQEKDCPGDKELYCAIWGEEPEEADF